MYDYLVIPLGGIFGWLALEGSLLSHSRSNSCRFCDFICFFFCCISVDHDCINGLDVTLRLALVGGTHTDEIMSLSSVLSMWIVFQTED